MDFQFTKHLKSTVIHKFYRKIIFEVLGFCLFIGPLQMCIYGKKKTAGCRISTF